MSNPFDQNDPNRPTGGQPNYDAYRYPSGGDNTPEAGYGGGATPQPDYGAGYGGAGYGGGPGGSTWAMEEEKNRVAPWALGVGIVALIGGVSILFSGFAFILGLIGLIIAIVAIVRARRIPGPGRRMGMSVAGLILSLIAIVISILFWVFAGFIINETGMMECFEISDPAQQQTCIENSFNTWLDS